tara:strand:- start:1184 stop:1351 length:168 start_codon:yes stop_codon:yes gene_type:complete
LLLLYALSPIIHQFDYSFISIAHQQLFLNMLISVQDGGFGSAFGTVVIPDEATNG